MLAVLLVYLFLQGWERVSWSFLNSFPSRVPEAAGIRAALLGSIYVVAIAGVVAFVLGVASAVYLEEFAGRSRFARIAWIKHFQPGRGAVDRLWAAGAGNLRPAPPDWARACWPGG